LGVEFHVGADASPVVYTGIFPGETTDDLAFRHEDSSLSEGTGLERPFGPYIGYTYTVGRLSSDCG